MIAALCATDRQPIQRAVLDDVLDGLGPLKYVVSVFPMPSGGVRVFDGWTEGAQPYGDDTDQAAVTAGFDALDWLVLLSRHRAHVVRGAVHIDVHDLPSIRHDITTGKRFDVSYDREFATVTPVGVAMLRRRSWHGVGPALCSANRVREGR